MQQQQQQQRRQRPSLFVKIDESYNSILDDDISYDKTEEDVEAKIKLINEQTKVFLDTASPLYIKGDLGQPGGCLLSVGHFILILIRKPTKQVYFFYAASRRYVKECPFVRRLVFAE